MQTKPVKIHIRQESTTDVQAIHDLVVAAFERAPHSGHNEQFIVRALRESGQLTLALVAECNDAIVGHIAISPVSLSDGTLHWHGLGPLSVNPQHQRQGLGSRLVEHAMQDLRKLDAAGCVVLGDPAFYRRFGFRPEASLTLPEFPAEFFQVLAFRHPLPTATVSYHASFSAQG